MSRAMKPSGIEWIGDIPEGWEVFKLGKIGNFSSSGIDKKSLPGEAEIKIINYTDVYRNKRLVLDNSMEYMTVTCAEEKRKNLLVRIGDLIFTPSSETIEEIGISALVIEKLENTSFSYHVLRYTTNRDFYLFYKKYLCNNHYVYNVFSRLANGTIRQTLRRDDFKSVRVVLPPLPEQQAIADYLDRKCELIDSTIEKQKTAIEKLKLYKQSVITEAVTKGLDPTVPMKPSGIEWIEDIPEGWEVINFKRIIKAVKDGTHGSFNRIEKGKLLLSAKNVFSEGLNISDDDSLISEEDFHAIVSNGFPQKHDILLTIVGTIGRAFVYNKEEPLAFQRSVCFIRLSERNSPFYYRYFILSKYFQDQLTNSSNVTAQSGVYMGKILNCLVITPPLPEQQAIADYLDQKCSQIDQAIELKQKLIEKLSNYKKSLIYECVTGKREVGAS